MNEIYDHFCQLCPLSSSPGNKSICIPGKGDIRSRALIVGEAPGATEDQDGSPFLGISGKKLNAAIEKAGYSPSELFITNAAKCRPPANRTPEKEELDACFDYLEKEVGYIDPVAVMTLGNAAMYSMTGLKGGVTKMAGLWRQVTYPSGDPLLVIPNLHPAYIARNPDKQSFFEEIVKDFLEVWRYGLNHNTEETWAYARP